MPRCRGRALDGDGREASKSGDAVSRARFEPARASELPVAVNMSGWSRTRQCAGKHPPARPPHLSQDAAARRCRRYRAAGRSTCTVPTLFIESVARIENPRSPSSPSIASS